MACLVRTIIAAAMVLLAMSPAAHSASDADCATAEAAHFEAWRAKCDAALAQETDPIQRAKLLYRRAYVSVEKHRYDDALKDLNAALAADPDNPLYLHERAYVNSELSEFAAALVDLDRQVALQPEEPTAYRERAHARHFSGDLAGAYEDRDKEVRLTPDSPQALLYRGEDALWIGRFADAAADAKRAGKLAKSARNNKAQADAAELLAQVESWRRTSPSRGSAARCTLDEGIDQKTPPTLIGDCTQAFLAATNGIAKADALTTRSVAWLVLANDQDSSTGDLRVAAALDPQSADRYLNLGFSYLSSRFSWAAKREFDRALELERNPFALAGRAAARKNLGDPTGARADAMASQEIYPNEAASGVLADLAFDEGDHDAARAHYLDAYRLGSRDDQLIARLKDLGVTDPAAAAERP
jgi:tetratricopeptide (TPR) repeat protein